MKINKFTLNGEVLTIHRQVNAIDSVPAECQPQYRLRLGEDGWLSYPEMLEVLGKLYRDIEDIMYTFMPEARHEVIRQFEKDWRDTDDPAQDSDGVRADAE